MKKILTLTCLLMCLNIFMTAQDDASKKFRFGLKITPEPTWLRSNSKKKVEPAGSIFGFGFGLITEFKLTDVASFSTGIGGDFEGGKQNFLDTTYYAIDADDEILKFEDVASFDSSIYSVYMLTGRKLKTTTINIPITLKLMTKEIGGMKYYGVFGINLGWLTKMRSTDDVKTVYEKGVYKGYVAAENTDVNPYHGTIPFRTALNVGFGTEFRMSGSTSLFASVNYIHQFFNSFLSDSKYYAEKLNPLTGKMEDKGTMSAIGSSVQINMGVMF
jgi:hypothetical protein